jgi:hypothetical protein
MLMSSPMLRWMSTPTLRPWRLETEGYRGRWPNECRQSCSWAIARRSFLSRICRPCRSSCPSVSSTSRPWFARSCADETRQSAGRITWQLYLLMDETLGALLSSQIPSWISFDLISQANIVGCAFLYLVMALITLGVATFGLEPPMTPGRIEPVCRYLEEHIHISLLFVGKSKPSRRRRTCRESSTHSHERPSIAVRCHTDECLAD